MFTSVAISRFGIRFLCIIFVLMVFIFTGCAPLEHTHPPDPRIGNLERNLERGEVSSHYVNYRVIKNYPLISTVEEANEALTLTFDIIKKHAAEPIGQKSRKLARQILLNMFQNPDLEFLHSMYKNDKREGGQAIRDLISYIRTGDKRFRTMGTKEHEVAGLFMRLAEPHLQRILRL
ncbi:MAG: hypothetical protein GY793_07980 [Proteobacteria bacterium]|nr:hypothetical protein [Pseudomonadota bacterium]